MTKVATLQAIFHSTTKLRNHHCMACLNGGNCNPIMSLPIEIFRHRGNEVHTSHYTTKPASDTRDLGFLRSRSLLTARFTAYR